LVDIGLDLLETRPIHELALDEVAAAAGVSRTLVFHYFPSKADFYAAVVASAGERLLLANPGDPSMDVDQRLRAMVAGFLRLVQRKRGAYVSLVRGASGGDPRVLAMLDELRASLVVRWLDAAEWPHRDAFTQLAVRGWLGALEEVALAAAVSQQPRELVVEHLVQGLLEDLERAVRLTGIMEPAAMGGPGG
ncbi:MAG: TetR/AcrR family transcriptional regulator, partial [Candidatus Nanopelagicales bacterium]